MHRNAEQSAENPRTMRPSVTEDDERRHAGLLIGVSRTFALTIPQLPDGLRTAVTNAYLLCRIADTIEDDPGLAFEEKDRFHAEFIAAIERGHGADRFAGELSARLASTALDAERKLIRECPQVLRITHALHPEQRRAIAHCVSSMVSGMSEFERRRDRIGLEDVAELERYCYFVAGVVGEMLTELFCSYSAKIDARRDVLESRSVSFGLGLQMTNILKDVWDDLERDTCWLPRQVFAAHGYDLTMLRPHHDGKGSAFAASMRQLIGITHGHLRRAVEYTLAIPRNETGIRRFLIWAALLAAATLRKIEAQPLFTSGGQVKVSRRKLAGIVTASSAAILSNAGLRALFRFAARGLPLVDAGRTEHLVGTLSEAS